MDFWTFEIGMTFMVQYKNRGRGRDRDRKGFYYELWA